jgi:hypothetical protein
MPKKQPGTQKPTVTNDDHDQNVGQRGEATKAGGAKIHGDDLEGAIPRTPMSIERPTRDDGDNDDEGALK